MISAKVGDSDTCEMLNAIFWRMFQIFKVKIITCVLLSCLNLVWLFVTLWTVACQAPQSIEFSRQEYWDELPCPLPGDLPNPGIKPESPVYLAWQADSLMWSYQGKPKNNIYTHIIERLLLNNKTRDSWPLEEMNSIWGQRRGWIAQSFCVIKFY